MKKQPSEGLCISVSVRFRRRGGRKLILSPDGVQQNIADTVKPDDVMMHALARAWKWQNMYEMVSMGRWMHSPSGIASISPTPHV